MTNKLKKAFDAASKLPPADQEALAAAILEEVVQAQTRLAYQLFRRDPFRIEPFRSR